MPSLWTIPRIWDGDTVAIIGGGPSLIGFDPLLLKGKRVIAVNSAFRLGQFEFCFYGDLRWTEDFGHGIESFKGIVVTTREEHLKRNVRVVRREPDMAGLSKRPELLHWNESSGACAINLATLLGAGKLILLGFDMKRVNGRNNFHEDYFRPDGTHAPVGDYEKMRGRFPAIAADLEQLGIECVNACPDSAIQCFPKCTIEEALAC